MTKMKTGQVINLPLTKIKQIENARLTYGREEMSELMTSLKHRGLLSPIGVRERGNGYEIVFGNRRLTAAKKLGWDSINAIVLTEVDTDDEMLIVNAVENMQRSDVPFAEQGRIFFDLEKQGLSVKEIAARIGISDKRVRQILDTYKSVPKAIREKVSLSVRPGERHRAGKIPASTAATISNMMSRTGLKVDEAAKLYDVAAKDGVTGLHIRRAGSLLRQGKSIKDAIRLAEKTRVVTVQVVVPIDMVKKIEKDHGMTIHNVFIEYLVDEFKLKI